MEGFCGRTYQIEKSENFDEYLKFIEVGFLLRKLASDMTVKCTLEKNSDGTYAFLMSNRFRSSRLSFTPGKEFMEERVDRVKVKSIITIEGNQLIQTQVEPNGRKSTHVREFTADTVVVTTTAEGWDGKCVRTYRFVE